MVSSFEAFSGYLKVIVLPGPFFLTPIQGHSRYWDISHLLPSSLFTEIGFTAGKQPVQDNTTLLLPASYALLGKCQYC